MKKSIYSLAVVTTMTLSAFSGHTFADDDDMQEIAVVSKEFGLISVDEAKTKALTAKSGVVTDVELENRKMSKGWDYEFEIVDNDGTEWEVNVDAKTGKVNGVNREWF